MNYQFFPTPPALAKRLWALFQNRNFVRVLEPHGGNGDLADAAPGNSDFNGRRYPIDCCEIDLARHPILREKCYSIVGTDFLQLRDAATYSHIILNPPFSTGAAHLLHAWRVLWDGEIACILNAETIRNPCNRERQMLLKLIEAHGSYEFAQDEFLVDDAQRKTPVEVALVYMRKQVDVGEDIVGNLLSEMREDAVTEDTIKKDFQSPNEVMIPKSAIENYVVAFNAANRSMREAVQSEARARYYASFLGDTLAARNDQGPKPPPKQTIEFVRSEVTKRYLDLKDRAWSSVLRSTNVTSKLSSAAQRRIEKEFESIKKLEFTLSNIYAFLVGICDSAGAIQMDMACDVFDLFSKYHSDNAVFFMGWKSNSRHRRAGMRLKMTRFILPHHGTESYHNSLKWDSEQQLNDIDKVFAMLDGKQAADLSLTQLFRDNFHSLRTGSRLASSYFEVRYYPGVGTIHFFPRSLELVDRLNRLVGRRRNWLPPETERVSKDFWLQYERAEKFDAAVRKEASKLSCNRYHSPMDHFTSAPSGKEHEAADEALSNALDTVLRAKGINVDFQLTHESDPQLLLAA